ncbi:DUF6602 domain-containing protein [Chitinophaga sp. GbtcB8]|uniref:DUF6602 domain-containing protein n=1 Tax=Chitinophaga sp. GbtcB8 TaxID=2824753 RepID=UPI001C3024AC|nr:DUF6602 domain-containing protein [Chitinophaga sp. GbtcB8]
MSSIGRFHLHTFFDEDAKTLISARQKGLAIHRTKNIDAAGDEIELPIRDIIRRRLPVNYYIGHGHIVDASLNTSGQFDVLIADNKGSPVLFRSENSTDYLTYESIYAIGEIKSTYYRSKHYVSEFVEKIRIVNQGMSRAKTPRDQLTQDLIFSGDGAVEIISSDPRPYKNPLFKFMFFVDSGDLDLTALYNDLNKADNRDCPNLICFLDRGVILKAEAKKGDTWDIGNIVFYPEFIDPGRGTDYQWLLYEFDVRTTAASTLAYLVYMLNEHVSSSMVLKPDLLKYHSNMFVVKQGIVIGSNSIVINNSITTSNDDHFSKCD